MCEFCLEWSVDYVYIIIISSELVRILAEDEKHLKHYHTECMKII